MFSIASKQPSTDAESAKGTDAPEKQQTARKALLIKVLGVGGLMCLALTILGIVMAAGGFDEPSKAISQVQNVDPHGGTLPATGGELMSQFKQDPVRTVAQFVSNNKVPVAVASALFVAVVVAVIVAVVLLTKKGESDQITGGEHDVDDVDEPVVQEGFFSNPVHIGLAVLGGGAVVVAIVFGIYCAVTRQSRVSHRTDVPVDLNVHQDAPAPSGPSEQQLQAIDRKITEIGSLYEEIKEAVKDEELVGEFKGTEGVQVCADPNVWWAFPDVTNDAELIAQYIRQEGTGETPWFPIPIDPNSFKAGYNRIDTKEEELWKFNIGAYNKQIAFLDGIIRRLRNATDNKREILSSWPPARV